MHHLPGTNQTPRTTHHAPRPRSSREDRAGPGPAGAPPHCGGGVAHLRAEVGGLSWPAPPALPLLRHCTRRSGWTGSLLAAAHRPCCDGSGAGPHPRVRRWGVARWGVAGAPTSPGMPQATSRPVHSVARVTGGGRASMRSPAGSSRPGHRRSLRSHHRWGREAAQAITRRTSIRKCRGVIR